MTSVSLTAASHIKKLDAALQEARKFAHTPQMKRGRMRQVYYLGVELKQQSDILVQNLTKGEAWLQKNEGHAKYREREDQWLQWLADYTAIQDALQRAEEIER